MIFEVRVVNIWQQMAALERKVHTDSADFYLGFVCLINFASCQFHPLDGIMKKHQKEKLQHLTTDGSTKVKKTVGNSGKFREIPGNSGPSSRRGRALKEVSLDFRP